MSARLAHAHAEIDALRQQMAQVYRERAQLPHRIPPYRGAPLILIIGGNTVNGVDCILYASTAPTITSLLDPNVTTAYSNGLGRGWLMSAAGQQLRRVLFWHDFAGYQSPMQGGYVIQARDTTQLTVASGPDAGKGMTFFRGTYPG